MPDVRSPRFRRPHRALGSALFACALSACGGGGGGGGSPPPPSGDSVLAGRVFLDANGDKVYDVGDALVQDVEVTLWDGDAFVGSTLTDANGQFRLDESVLAPALVPGASYEVRVLVEQPSLLTGADLIYGMGWMPGVLDTPNAGVDDAVDSDAVEAMRNGQTHGVITATAPAAGQTDATLGFGFQGVAPPPPPKPTR
ncbi:MAG: hypothetical protein R3F05_03320 [Planctomycetota bacterium]|nr:hypothetical protein [Planctomycetota bacterium]MCB9824939.1 hypothetical protein [Planctomycetota bacterium]MCB9901669.1 hypothetical protein [Planctomycetota bacterium]